MEPTSQETAERKPIIVPKEASQLFGAYLRQEFKESLEAIGKPQNQRLIHFIDNLETSKEVKIVGQDVLWDFEFSKEKGKATPIADSFILDKHLTHPFLSAIDHNVRNALGYLMVFHEEACVKMVGVLTALPNTRGLEMSRDENGKVKVIPLSHPTA